MSEQEVTPTPAADDTAKSEGAEQTLLDPQTTPPAPGEQSKGEESGGKPAETKESDGALLDPKEGEEKKPEGAPEAYADFTMPEGFTLADAEKEKVTGLFRELNLSQDGAQKLVDYFTQRLADDKAAELEALASRRREWRAEVRKHPNFAAERALAQRGMRAVITDDAEKEMFTDTWMSDHPVVWGIFVKIGKLLGEDTLPTGGGAAPLTEDQINRQRFPVE